MHLSPAQIERFWTDGFLVLDRITPAEEVVRLRATLDRLFQTRAGWKEGAQFDMLGQEAAEIPQALPQLLRPVHFAPELERTIFRANALAIARQLIGAGAHFWFEHAILKPAGRGAATPWHQDEAHRSDPGLDYDQISVWMPLQPATETNGCMQYVPGSHRGPVLAHRSPGGDPRSMALECAGEFDRAGAVACPLPAGGAVIHHARTLHHAGRNESDIARLAYILAFRGNLRENPEFRGYPWNAEKATPAQERAKAWQHRGGPLGRLARAAGRAMKEFARKVRRAAAKLRP